jgi:Bacterial Ig-like domain (group 3)/FG-GAP-like repeat
VSVLAGNGDGTFQQAVTYAGANSPISIVAADINRDGKLDVVVAKWGTSDSGSNAGAVSVLLGNGNGTLQPVLTYLSGGAEARSVAVADLNGDHKPDIALACVDDPLTGTQGVASVSLNNSPSLRDHIALTSSGSPSQAGQPVTFTAKVLSKSGVVPDGELVTFNDGKVVLGTAPLSGGSATLTTSALSVGSHKIVAIYPGDSNFMASRKRIVQVVNP